MKIIGTLIYKCIVAFKKIVRIRRSSQQDNYSSFKHSGYTTFISMALLAILNIAAQKTNAQIAYSTVGANYTQNFDNLYTTVPANNTTQAASILPTGWAFVEAGTNASTTLRNDNGSSGTGDTYLDGATNSNERSFGSYASGSLTSQFGASFTNSTGVTLTQFTLSYTGEQWKDGGSGSAVFNTQSFAYSVGASSLTTGTYINVTQLDFTALVNNSSADVTLDGNLPANQRAISFTVTGISWPSGTTMFIRWTDINDAGNDDNLAIDGLTFSANTSCTAPSITSITRNSPLCANGTLNLSVAATGTSPLTYQWSGAGSFSSTTVSNPSVTSAATGSYTVTVTNACGSSTSNTSVTVNANVTPSVSIASNAGTTICAGTNVTFTATPTNGGTPSYQWKLNGGNVGANSTTYSNNALSNNDQVTCVMTSTATCASPLSVTSNAITMTVNPVVTPSVSIAASPSSTICSGTNVTLTATAVNGGAAPQYEFFLNSNSVQSGTSNTYSSSLLADNDVITCTLTSNAACQTASSANSNTITINVTSTVTPSVSIASNTASTICAGTNVTFTATPVNGGATPSYQWKLNGSNVGTNSDTYSNNTLADQDVVSCIMTSSNGCALPTTATSNDLTITVIPNVTPSVSISADPGNTICEATSVTFTATPVNGGTPSYQWTKNGNNVGTNSATYTDASLVNNDVIVCTMTSTETCVTAATAVSNTVTMSVSPVPTPSITGTLTFCTGNSTTLDAGAGYTSYVWNTTETSQTISVTSAGSYSVTVSNGTCTATSAPVTVNEISAPAQPGAFTASTANVYTGQNGVVYTVPNVPGVTYVWSYSGTGATINGTANSVSVNFSGSATSGTLSVTANNICGASTARNLAITVTVRPDMRITEYEYNGSEFIELTNIGSASINMAGWSYDDNSRVAGSFSLGAFGVVQAGESVIISEEAEAAFRTRWNLCAGVKVIGGSTQNLGRADEINIYDASNILVDRLTFDDQTLGGPRTDVKSAWVPATALGNNTISQWVASTVADAEGSYISVTGGFIASPGKSTRATVVYNPCIVVNGAPTIVMNVSTTSNYIDGGVLVSPPTPYGLSGVIGDATDPASTLGIDFTIGDDVTPVNSLTVSVTSSNTSVVPDANLNLTGSGAARNLMITPIGVGYSSITVTVNDGTNNTSYTINYAASSPDPGIIPANTVWHTGMSDASDAIALDDNYYITGDDELDILNVYSRYSSGLPLVSYDYASHLSLPDPSKPEVDVEAAARSVTFPNRVYWTGSMSNGKTPFDNKPNRDRLFATTVNGTGNNTSFSFVGYYNVRTALLAWGDANGYNFTAAASAGINPKSFSGFSLEGMVMGPDGTTMFLGLRAPLVPTTLRQNAVIAPILNFETWFNNGVPSGPPVFGTPIELNLDFRGIRDIIRLSNGTYIIIAGSPIEDGGINNIYKWTGYATDAPVPVDNLAGGTLNMEGLMEVNDTPGQLSLSKLQIVSDGGLQILYQDNNEAKDFNDLHLRKFRTDVITGLDLDICSGFTASITTSGTTNVCPGNSVTLTAPAGANITYLWSTGATTQAISVSAFHNYTVAITSTTSGCSSSSTSVTITNALPSDFNGDHVTNNNDFLSLLGVFGQSCSGCSEDINNDGVVNNNDFLILLGQFGHTCP